ncbi:hypothetical protein GCM10027063_36010 [Promicromonospora xylanilytica]
MVNQVLDRAVVHDALRDNPMRKTIAPSKEKPQPKAITALDIGRRMRYGLWRSGSWFVHPRRPEATVLRRHQKSGWVPTRTKVGLCRSRPCSVHCAFVARAVLRGIIT